MASTTIQATADSWVEQDVPAANHAGNVYLSTNGDASHGRRAYLWFAAPFDLGSTVNAATLNLYLSEAWSGTTTITAKRITTPWGDDTVNWANKPTTTATNQATAVVTSGVAGQLVTFTITAMLADVAGGADFYGIELSSNVSAVHNFVSTSAPADDATGLALRPYASFDFSLPITAPINLAPDGGFAVSTPKPVVSWDFATDDDDRQQASSCVQIGTVADFSSIEFNSGTVANVVSNFDLSATAYGGVPSGASRYWRVNVVDDVGRASPFSDAATFSYSPLGTFTVSVPAALAGTGPVGTSVLDDFNRANTGPPLSANWANQNTGWKVVSNAAVTAAAGVQGAKWLTSYSVPVEAFATLTTLTGTYEFDLELMTDFDSVGSGYQASIQNGGATAIYRYDNGVKNATALASATIAWASGDKIGLSVDADGNVVLYRFTGGNWTAVLTAKDSTYAAALFPIIVANNTSLVVDDFGGGDAASIVDETTPGIAWSLTGATQEAVELVVLKTNTRAPDESDDVQPADPNESPYPDPSSDLDFTGDGTDGVAIVEDAEPPLEVWRFPKTLTTAGTVNVPEDLIDSGGVYQLAARNWDTVNRQSIYSAPDYKAVTRPFIYKRAGGPAAVTDLVATNYPNSTAPGVELTWTDGGSIPDYWSLRVDGIEVVQRILPVNTLYGVTGGSVGLHRYRFWRTQPGARHRFVIDGVKILTNRKKHSKGNKRRYLSMKVVGVWLVDPSRDLCVMIRGTDAPDLTLREVGTTFDLVGSDTPVRILDSLGGYSGTVDGTIMGPANRNRFRRLKGISRGKRLRLVFSDLNLPVRLEETSISPIGSTPPGNREFAVSFSFFQDGEVSYKPGTH